MHGQQSPQVRREEAVLNNWEHTYMRAASSLLGDPKIANAMGTHHMTEHKEIEQVLVASLWTFRSIQSGNLKPCFLGRTASACAAHSPAWRTA